MISSALTFVSFHGSILSDRNKTLTWRGNKLSRLLNLSPKSLLSEMCSDFLKPAYLISSLVFLLLLSPVSAGALNRQAFNKWLIHKRQCPPQSRAFALASSTMTIIKNAVDRSMPSDSDQQLINLNQLINNRYPRITHHCLNMPFGESSEEDILFVCMPIDKISPTFSSFDYSLGCLLLCCLAAGKKDFIVLVTDWTYAVRDKGFEVSAVKGWTIRK